MNLIEALEHEILLLDSAMGTALIAAGALPAGERSERANVINPGIVEDIHRRNIEAGSDIITTNTFGVFGAAGSAPDDAEAALRAGVRIAKKAAESASAETMNKPRRIFTALGMGPTGDIIGLTSSLSHDDAREIFGRMAAIGAEEGADLILIETMSDIEELKDAVIASKERTDIPVICSMSFDENGYTYMGVNPDDFVRAARSAGADAVGANCGIGPLEMLPVAEALLQAADGRLPVFVQPNAGKPGMRGTEVFYDMTPAAFSDGVSAMICAGVNLVGGCCGTTTDMISLMRSYIDKKT